MKYDCDIIKDLMPLYIDDLLSDNSKKFVEDHINNCESCKKYYEKLSGEVKIPSSKDLRKSDLKPIEYLKANLSKKIITRVLGTILIIGLSVSGFIFVNHYDLPVDPAKVEFYEKDDYLMMKYQGKGGILFSANGSWENQKIWTIKFWQTPWTRYIRPLYRNEQYDNDFVELERVDKVYDENGNVLWEKKDR
ncbi:zf-HC2 domain-containing protein [uncultured Anaerococcus sp.]|uniref:zf-HC2 domain-containing protein n=1 Tax=uncultured Anaerococcus sp. TaxID=293428 RepID=UPI0025D9E9B5|nr:zf-HC2 domain-containing protein [uncultured Anaerococcus sp.]